jgi:hypothetical protein
MVFFIGAFGISLIIIYIYYQSVSFDLGTEGNTGFK